MRILFKIILSLFILAGSASAQVIDDSSIQDAQKSGYTFVEGMFVAYLADTVSPDFINKQFKKLEIAVLEESIKPMVISIVNSPSKESVEELRNHPKVLAFYTAIPRAENVEMEIYLNDAGFSEDQKKQIRNKVEQSEMYFVELDYSVNKNALKTLMSQFRDVAYKILSDQPRSVTLKAEPGKEPLLMDKVNNLPFVKSTAMIGTIK
jgi:hypothetical protein